MNCSACGSQPPPGAKVCPNCGTPTSAYYSDSGTASYDPTVVSTPYGAQAGSLPSYDPTIAASPSSAPAQIPSTGYGANPYTPPPTPSGQQNPYTPPPLQSTPYVTQQTGSQPSYPPPINPAGLPEQKQPRRFPAGIIALLIVLAVLLIGGSVLIYYTTVYQPNQIHSQATATAVVQSTGTAHAQTSTAQARVNATATAAVENPYTHSGTLALSDPLSDNSKGHSWDENTNCAFVSGTYHAIAPDPHFSDYCIGKGTNFSDFAFEAQMQIIKGDAGGLIFRVTSINPTNKYYELDFRQDGFYELDVVNESGKRLTSGFSAALNQGLNASNLIAVVVQGTTITVYMNHRQITSVTDSTYSRGQIGFLASVYSLPTEVVFSNARVWTL